MCGCDCKRELACKMFTVKLKFNDSVIIDTILCSRIDYEIDKQFEKSVNEIKLKFKSDSTLILEKDSIYIKHFAKSLDCSEEEIYKANGWACNCYR
jgi:hypothetical protein